jgi:hypothetical protein
LSVKSAETYLLQPIGQVQPGSPGWQSGVQGQHTQLGVFLQVSFFFVVELVNATAPATNIVAQMPKTIFFILNDFNCLTLFD